MSICHLVCAYIYIICQFVIAIFNGIKFDCFLAVRMTCSCKEKSETLERE